MMGSYRAKNVSITELLKAHARGLLPGLLDVDQGNREAILRALNNWGWDSSLKLYLPFDETSGATAHDLSGNGNTGTATGTTIVDGVFGKARSFDGVDDCVDCGNDASLDITDAITLEAWVKESVRASSAKVINRRTGLAFYFLGSGDGLPYGGVGDGTNFSTVTKDTVMTLNEWHHLVFTFVDAQDTGWLYEDGVLVKEGGIPCGIGNLSGLKVSVGADINGATYYYTGLIDEVRIYSRALTADEIYLHYLAGALKLGLI